MFAVPGIESQQLIFNVRMDTNQVHCTAKNTVIIQCTKSINLFNILTNNYDHSHIYLFNISASLTKSSLYQVI